MNNLEKLSLLTCQSISADGLIEHLDQEPGKESPAEKVRKILIDASKPTFTNPAHQTAKTNLIHRSALIIKNSLKQPQNGLIQKISHIFSKHVLGQNRDREKNEILQVLNQFENRINEQQIGSHLEALCKFMSEFKVRFGVAPDAMKGAEIDDIFETSRRFWESENVQSLETEQRYAKYAELMEEKFIGSHILYVEESPDSSLFSSLRQKVGIGSKNEPYQKISTKLEPRVSSHYGKVGDHVQFHIRGNFESEVLIHQGYVAIKDGKIVAKTNENGKKESAYWDKLAPEGKPLLPKLQNAEKVFVTWAQNESYPDGPDWKSWILHRTIDFGLYQYLKNIGDPKRPQVAKHKLVVPRNVDGTGRRGLPDTTPIIVWPRDYRRKPIPIHSKM